MDKPSPKVLRGLRWIHEHASGDYETVAEQKDHFPGTNPKEVEAALEWLERILRQ